MSEALEQNPSDTIELKLRTVVITRDNSKLVRDVPAHEIPILELIHTPENIEDQGEAKDADGNVPTIEVSANAEQELLRLRNKYDQKNDQVVQAVFRGPRDLERDGFHAGEKAARPVRSQVKTRSTKPAAKAKK